VAQVSASLTVFGDAVEVTADLQHSEHDNDYFVSIKLGRVYVAFDMPTARELLSALDDVLHEHEAIERAAKEEDADAQVLAANELLRQRLAEREAEAIGEELPAVAK
jgi:hypothetical protein